ncbi:hypothetical protein Sbal223_1477 [Shewanella baltica OS223]|uniref:hypothetical protein n=1 Tax=Shewanella baltica TaxID=62322 RepID=UPI0001531062|nr:hypothetical protein [Shewanella baltica]ACK45984.1 hypothetical protein Sbal223_1477 [Shewanella baltica OS223]
MLIIHNSLGLGGIETFILRLVRQRFSSGLKTKILLIANKKHNDSNILSDVNKYADIYYVDDVSYGLLLPFFNLSAFYNKKKLQSLLSDSKSIHVTFGNALMIAEKIIAVSNISLPISVGFYHSMEFCWGKGRLLPYYERVNRKLLFEGIPVQNLFLFSSSIIDFYKDYVSINLDGAATFRIGTVSISGGENLIRKYDDFCHNRIFKICSVGRLVDFKKYNLWMIDVVNELRMKGFNVQYHVFGDGPLYNEMHDKIKALDLEDYVFQIKSLQYAKFDEIVSEFDFFVGSGTAIIQAASLGVCSIVGIESLTEPQSYGYFNEVAKFDYNLKSIKLPLISVESLILKFIMMTQQEKRDIISGHIASCHEFSMELCSQNFESANLEFSRLRKRTIVEYVLYDCSRLISAVARRLHKGHVLNSLYDRV